MQENTSDNKDELEIDNSLKAIEQTGANVVSNSLIKKILALLPPGVLGELKSGEINYHDPAFQKALKEHILHLSGDKKAELNRILKTNQKEIKKVSGDRGITEYKDTRAVGRNDKCPCGSGKKYKQCCIRKNKDRF
jgi:hypothetical protein